MANTPEGSFIPKRSTGKITTSRSGRRVYIFSYVSYVFFFGTLLSVVGIFFLNTQAGNNLQQIVSNFNEIQETVNKNQLESIRDLDTRLRVAKHILDLHAAPSTIFETLESVIVSDVQLDSFEYVRENRGGVTLTLGGLTGTFDALLFQRNVIKNNALLAAADITEVKYGSPETLIENIDRAGGSLQNRKAGKASVMFIFENDSVLESIGYKPRGMIKDPISITEDEVTESVSDDEVDNLDE